MDMRVERDVLQEVFERLKGEYALRGWVIEYIDLRWGISPESSTDNRTIQICLEELRRCREVSPRPNFIILSGQRRGWIPIPEVLDSTSYEWLRNKCKGDDFRLIEKWYEGDFNAYPDPVYNLRSKVAYGDASIFDADLPGLEAVFKRSGYQAYGLSATELEIRNGIFKGETDNVMGYIRTLTDIPRELKSSYTSDTISDWWEIKGLHRQLKKAIEPHNLISHKISYAELMSQEYHDRLAGEFENCLRTLIDKEVERNVATNVMADEQELHETFAREESARLIGRVEEQAQIRRYVECGDKIMRMWYVAPSGMGKSALLARAAATYLDNPDYNVITIFCGLTPQTSTVQGMLEYLCYRLMQLSNQKKVRVPDPFSSSYGVSLAGLSTEMLKASREKPLIVVIDSLDRLDYGGLDKPDILGIFPTARRGDSIYYKNATKIRVVISTVDDYEWVYTNTTDIEQIPLFSIDDRNDFIKTLLLRSNRSLTPVQSRLAEQAATGSDGRAVYLSLLVKCCVQLRSSDTHCELPCDFESLMYRYLDAIIDLHHYDPNMVRMSLALIGCSNGGLRHDDMSLLLAMDTEVWKKFCSEISHAITRNTGDSLRLPPIVWTRLYYDLRPLLRTSYPASIGETFDFSHPTITRTIMGFVGDEVRSKATRYLCDYFGTLWSQGDALALDRIIAVILGREDLNMNIRGQLACDIYANPDFFIARHLSRINALEIDSDRISKAIHTAGEPSTIAFELQPLLNDNKDNLKRRIFNLYDTAVSKQHLLSACNVYDDLLSDTLRNNSLYTSIVAYTGRLEHPSMDGTAVYGLRNGKSEWWCYDYLKGKQMIRGCSDLSVSGPVHIEGNFSFDENGELVNEMRTTINLDGIMTDTPARRHGKYQAYCTGYTGQGYEIEVTLWETGDVVMRYPGLQDPPQWMEFSPGGKVLFVGNETDGTLRLDLTTLSVTFNRYFKFKKAYISNNSDNLWALGKIDFSKETSKRYDPLHRFDTTHNFEYTKEWITYRLPINVAIWINYLYIDDIHHLLYVFYGDGGCARFNLDETSPTDRNLVPKEIRYTYTVDAVSVDNDHNIGLAYCKNRGVIFDFRRQWDLMAKEGDGFAQANALTSDYAGRRLCLTYGQRVQAFATRELFIYNTEPVDNGLQQTQSLVSSPLSLPISIDLVCNSAISPDGGTVAFSSIGGEGLHPDQSGIGIIDLRTNRWAAWITCNAALNIVFSADGNYTYFIGSQWLIDNKMNLIVLNRKFEIVYQKNYEERVNDVYIRQCVSLSGRYVAIFNFANFTGYITDLMTGGEHTVDIKTMFKFDGLESHLHRSTLASTVDDTMYLGIGSTVIHFDPATLKHKVIATFDNGISLRAISRDGKRIWLIDIKHNLYRIDTDTMATTLIGDHVFNVFECNDCRHMFVQKAYMTKSRSETSDFYRDSLPTQVTFSTVRNPHDALEYALPQKQAARCVLTDRGLAITDIDNDLQYFVPSPRHGMNSEVVAKVTERVDIENHCMRRASVVCPACAREFIPAEGPGYYECPNCHRTVHVI